MRLWFQRCPCHWQIEGLEVLVSPHLLSLFDFVVEVDAGGWSVFVFGCEVVPVVIITTFHFDFALFRHCEGHSLADAINILWSHLRNKACISRNLLVTITSRHCFKSPEAFARNKPSISWSVLEWDFSISRNRVGSLATSRLDLSQWKLSWSMTV